LLPKWLLPKKHKEKLVSLFREEDVYIRKRVDYYNKLDCFEELGDKAIRLLDLKIGARNKTYFFDTYEYIRYFNGSLKANFLFGDITTVPPRPALLKSRPVAGDNARSVVLNLNKNRHFSFLKDGRVFEKKENKIVWRGHVSDTKPHRILFLQDYFNHPKCDVGYTNKFDKYVQWAKPKLTIEQQLGYKFILCIEGNDVATNLKWVMSSNSLAVMSKPKYETWFMEGTLIPNYHYVLVKDDYSDLEERLDYYIDHTDEGLQIIKNAHSYIDQFSNQRREDLISLLVLDKYFLCTGQKP
jgi:hypothetical protein